MSDPIVAPANSGARSYAHQDRLEVDPRVFAVSCLSMGAGALTVVAPMAVLLVGLAMHADWVVPASVTTLFVFATLWIAGWIGFQIVFVKEAVKVRDGLPKIDIPRVVEAPRGVIDGQPELAVKLPTRCLLGRIGKCQIEFYPQGLQIWRGPGQPEPRWQFAYTDLAQAELLDVAVNAKTTSHQHYVRLIAVRPRMAFLFKNTWSLSNGTSLILSKLAEHKVVTFSEELDC